MLDFKNFRIRKQGASTFILAVLLSGFALLGLAGLSIIVGDVEDATIPSSRGRAQDIVLQYASPSRCRGASEVSSFVGTANIITANGDDVAIIQLSVPIYEEIPNQTDLNSDGDMEDTLTQVAVVPEAWRQTGTSISGANQNSVLVYTSITDIVMASMDAIPIGHIAYHTGRGCWTSESFWCGIDDTREDCLSQSELF